MAPLFKVRLQVDFFRRWQYRLDFEISDALAKLERLGLAGREAGDRWRAYPLEQALAMLST